LQPDNAKALRDEAEEKIAAARQAFLAECNPLLRPLHLASLAWTLNQYACIPGQDDDAALLMATAVEHGETAVKSAVPRTFAAFQCRLFLAHILIRTLAFGPPRNGEPRPQVVLERATQLAREAMDECIAQDLDAEHFHRAADLLILTSQSAYELLGDEAELQAATQRLSDLCVGRSALAPQDGHLAIAVAQLRYSHFERTGDPVDLDEAIRIGEEFLIQTHGKCGVPVSSQQGHSILFVLSNALASRAEARNDTEQASADAGRAVDLARQLVTTPDGSALGPALAANALGFALRALGHVKRDLRPLDEALQHFLRGIAATGARCALWDLMVNNAASLLGELENWNAHHDDPAFTEAISKALAMLELILGTVGPDVTFGSAQTLFNYGYLSLRQSRRGQTVNLTLALRALERCLSMLPPGHPRRAQTLSALAITLTQPGAAELAENVTDRALDAALEAEAIAESGTPNLGWMPDCVTVAEAAWREAGRPEAELDRRRATAVRMLIPTAAEYALPMAVRRGLSALAVDNNATGALYAEIACAARERAMIVADDAVAAAQIAAIRRVDLLAGHAAIAIAGTSPELAAFLLERGQGSVIARLQMSLAQPRTTGAAPPPALLAHRASCARLRRVLDERRRGILAATPEALRQAEAELEASIAAVRRLPGLDGFLVQVHEQGALPALSRNCLYLAAGENSGLALLRKQDGNLRTMPLPGLDQRSVTAWTERYLGALHTLEGEGVAALPAFLAAVTDTAEWLRAAGWQPILASLDNSRPTVIPCGILAPLPWNAITDGIPVTYCPSAQIRARAPVPSASLPLLLVCDPGHQEQPDLPFADRLGRRLTGSIPVTVLSGAAATPTAVVDAARRHNTILFYAHGVTEMDDPLRSGVLLHGMSRLDVQSIVANGDAFAGCTIILASCSQGQIDPAIPGEMFGPATSFLAGGAAAVIAPVWPVEALSAQHVAVGYVFGRLKGLTSAEALAAAQESIRRADRLNSEEFRLAGLHRGRATANRTLDYTHPFFHAAFVAYGSNLCIDRSC